MVEIGILNGIEKASARDIEANLHRIKDVSPLDLIERILNMEGIINKDLNVTVEIETFNNTEKVSIQNIKEKADEVKIVRT